MEEHAEAPTIDAPTREPGLGFEKWMGFLSSFVAPLTLVTALLFYFGYVSTREFFRYFGVDVDLIGLSSQEFVMRSPGALFVPVMVLLLLAAGLMVGHRLLRRWLERQPVPRRRRVIAVLAWSGIALLLAGLAMAFLIPVIDWPVAQLLAPLLLAVGAGLSAYAASTVRALGGRTIGRSVVVILVLVLVAGTFWSTATIAQWWGLGQARALASDLRALPAVVLDSKDRLYPGNDDITFQELGAEASAPTDGDPPPAPTYGYRYFGLRLLAQGSGRLYLVPDAWSADASTLVVPYDDVRVRFRFLPDEDAPTDG
jgi:hypothetical protein